MRTDERGEIRLLLAREPRHVGVRDEVRAVGMVAAVAEREANLVQARGPRQQHAQLGRLQLPRGGGSIEQLVRDRLDARSLTAIGRESIRHPLDGAIADVLVRDATDGVVEQPLAQRTGGGEHAIDLERLEHADEDREPAGQHADALARQPGQRDLADAAHADQCLAQRSQALARDRIAPAVRAQDGLDRRHRARRPHRLRPAELEERRLDRLELDERRGGGLAERLAPQPTIGEEAVRVPDAAHVQALSALRVELLADDELGAAATDVDDEPTAAAVRERVRHTEVDEPGFLAARNHLDGVTERGRGLAQEVAGVPSLAQRVGTHCAHAHAPRGAQALTEPPQALEAARLGLGGEVAALVEARRELHALAHAIEDGELAVDLAGDDHVEAVGPEVHRDQLLGVVAHGARHRF